MFCWLMTKWHVAEQPPSSMLIHQGVVPKPRPRALTQLVDLQMATMRAHVLPSLFAVLDVPHKIGHPSGSVRMSIAASPRISTLETPVNRNGEGSPNIPKAKVPSKSPKYLRMLVNKKPYSTNMWDTPWLYNPLLHLWARHKMVTAPMLNALDAWTELQYVIHRNFQGHDRCNTIKPDSGQTYDKPSVLEVLGASLLCSNDLATGTTEYVLSWLGVNGWVHWNPCRLPICPPQWGIRLQQAFAAGFSLAMRQSSFLIRE